MPKKEWRQRVYLRPDEFSKMLAVAGANPRDFAILQLFLQTGIRLWELVNLRLDDVDLVNRTIRITGKGNKQRELVLEKKASQALTSYLRGRAESSDDHAFISYQGTGLSITAVKKLVVKYQALAGITKRIVRTRFVTRLPRTRQSMASLPSSCRSGLATPRSQPLRSTCIFRRTAVAS